MGRFPRFVRLLRKRWREELPQLEPIDFSASSLPKSSTFVWRTGWKDRRLLVNLQPSSKAWEVGQFTVNLLVSESDGPPTPIEPPGRRFDHGDVGRYRIGRLTDAHKDKWWCLEPEPEWTVKLTGRLDAGSRLFARFRPASYEDEAKVFDEVADDLTRDVRHVLARAARWVDVEG